MAWLHLVRWKNLLIIFFTQLFVWWFIVVPLEPSILNFVNFFLLSLSTVLIAAAGYIINDYFDNKIDAINKPGKVVLGKSIPRKQAIIYHSVLNGIALVLAGIIALRAHHPEWLSIQVACTLLLWYYSTNFKRQLITGNIIIALLTAFTIITLMIYEPRLRYLLEGQIFEQTGNGILLLNPSWLLLFYALFAFLLTWIREIVKDMEDMQGDADQGCMTVPIQWGLSGATRFIWVLGGITAICLLLSGFRLLHSDKLITGWYLLLIITPYLLFWLFFLGRKFTKEHYHAVSIHLKIIMVLGLASLVVDALF